MGRSLDFLVPAILALGVPLVTLLPAQAGLPVLVIAAPWADAAGTVALVGRAEGAILRGTAIPWIAVAVSSQPDFPGRLRRAGAWMVLDAALASGCGGARSE